MLKGKVWSFIGLAVLMATVVLSSYASGFGKFFLMKYECLYSLLKKPGNVTCYMRGKHFILGANTCKPQAQEQIFRRCKFVL